MDETATIATGAAPGGEDGSRPTTLLPASHLLRISAYWLGLTAIDSAVNIVVQNRINFDRRLMPDELMIGTTTALVGLAGAILSILIQPTVGYISDFAVTRWGRRKPFIVVGSLLDVLFLLGIAYSNTLLALAAFVALLSVSTNIARG
ncbi:MAG TPA: MFS transporter, partial [Candidatus Limnocylindrales bacterium]